jgi:alkylation response protein AidB-like acyl-CoA dehydrogenase
VQRGEGDWREGLSSGMAVLTEGGAMDFDLSEGQKAFQRAMRGVCETELAARARSADEAGAVPDDNLRALARVGYMGLLIPEAHGGSGGEAVSTVLGTEEIARICPSTALVAGVTLMRFAVPLILYGTRPQREIFLPAVAAGEMRGAWAVTEATGGSDTRSLVTRARRTSEGYSLTGEKLYVFNGPEAGGVLVAASQEEGEGAFVLRTPLAGMTALRETRMVGARGAAVGTLRFEACPLPLEARLGGDEGPTPGELERLPHGSLLMAAYALGVGQACLEAAVRHSRERVISGRPIVRFQEVHFKIADMQVSVDVARQLSLRAAWLTDQGRGSVAEASAAKLFASETAALCGQQCAQIHGGRGLLAGEPPDRLWRDGRMALVAGGTAEMHRLAIASELLAGRA